MSAPNQIAVDIAAFIDDADRKIVELTAQRERLVAQYQLALAGVCPYCTVARAGVLHVDTCFHGLKFRVVDQTAQTDQPKE